MAQRGPHDGGANRRPSRRGFARGLLLGVGIAATLGVGGRAWLSSLEEDAGLPPDSPWRRDPAVAPHVLATGGLMPPPGGDALDAIAAAEEGGLAGVRLDVALDGRGTPIVLAQRAPPPLIHALAVPTRRFLFELHLRPDGGSGDPRATAEAVAVAVNRARGETAARTLVTSTSFRMLRAAGGSLDGGGIGVVYARDGLLGPTMAGSAMRLGLLSLPLGAGAVVIEPDWLNATTVERFHRRRMAVGTGTLLPKGADPGRVETDVARFWALADTGVDWIAVGDPSPLLP